VALTDMYFNRDVVCVSHKKRFTYSEPGKKVGGYSKKKGG
jgi:hypothetical protein